MDNNEFLLENRLRVLDPALHRRFTDTVTVMYEMLPRFRLLFPDYTDHSVYHSLDVIDFCNRIIGPEQIVTLDPDSIFVLLMSCYLHDVGMGVSKDEFEEIKSKIPVGDYYDTHPDADTARFVRDFHHEFSGLLIKRYSEMLEIPSKEHEFAIVQISRGHRKTDLFNPEEYPEALEVPGGNRICLPYLSALLRLADEIDVIDSRNPKLLYDVELMTEDIDILFHRRHQAVKDLLITDDAFVVEVETDDEELRKVIVKMVEKMQETLDECRKVTEERSPFTIRQKTVEIKWLG